MILPLVLGVGLLLPTPLPQIKEDVKPMEFKVVKSDYELQIEEERKWKDGSLTSYYNGKDEMNGESGITASGINLDDGISYLGYRILATDRSIEFGTLIDIKLESGEIIHGIALDRGGRIVAGHMDIVQRSHNDCIIFGIKQTKWKIVGKVDI